MTDAEPSSSTTTAANQGLKDLLQKVEATLAPAIEEHVGSDDFEANKDGLDFLDVKNSLLLSYLIDLVHHFSENKSSSDDDEEEAGGNNMERLTEMKIALEKIRPLEKKMRYQLDKLLSSNDSSTFATSNTSAGDADPLSFRPNPEALKEEDNTNKGLSSDDDGSSDDDDDDSDDNVDDDLAAARATLKLAGSEKNKEQDDGVYRAPRLAATPYPASGGATNDEEKQKRFTKKLRATELAKTLREQYGDAPEQEDLHGGADLGRQREASRRLHEIEKEKTKFEEDNMVRLTTSRKQKKEKRRLMRAETSNLSAISDLGNLTRSVSVAFDEKPSRGSMDSPDDMVRGSKKKKIRDIRAKNPLQKALYGGSHEGGEAKKKQKKRR
eukprot:CAMPEP_0119003830 /NCGR_PEP_ID=MMETSP1176-20130426/790_1 /TAXON_ID=265551 /ORGANISM="Synedropsis recta cf, Strain CCMP1620" /LENGTH=382 /DNA_ID=CAMNT_0006955467 /DNA_START=38 /DNA_END=1186 /DNA_ORIENTATION=-